MSKDWNAAIEAAPCWHCGNDGTGPVEEALHVVHIEDSDHHSYDRYTVQCDKCPATMGYFDTEAEAIAAWNTRKPTTPTTGEDDVERPTVTREMVEAADAYWRGKAYHKGDQLFSLPGTFNWHELLNAALAAISPTTEDAEKRELVEALGPFAAGVFNDNGDLTIRTHFDAADVERAYFVHRKALASIGERS